LLINNIEISACKLEYLKNPIIYFINQERKGEINCNCVCAINRQNYGPCQYGSPSLNSSPVINNLENANKVKCTETTVMKVLVLLLIVWFEDSDLVQLGGKGSSLL
jgi:hypothetical protein